MPNYLSDADSKTVGEIVTEMRQLIDRLERQIGCVIDGIDPDYGETGLTCLYQENCLGLTLDMIADCGDTANRLYERLEIDPDDGLEIEY